MAYGAPSIAALNALMATCIVSLFFVQTSGPPPAIVRNSTMAAVASIASQALSSVGVFNLAILTDTLPHVSTILVNRSLVSVLSHAA